MVGQDYADLPTNRRRPSQQTAFESVRACSIATHYIIIFSFILVMYAENDTEVLICAKLFLANPSPNLMMIPWRVRELVLRGL